MDALQHVTIHRVEVIGQHGRALATFGPDFVSWVTFNTDNEVVDANGLSFTTSTVDAAVVKPIEIVTGGGRPKFVDTVDSSAPTAILTQHDRPRPADLDLGGGRGHTTTVGVLPPATARWQS